MRAVDFSFSATQVTEDWARHRLDEGVELFIGNLYTGSASIFGMENALRECANAGGVIAGYFNVHPTRSAEYCLEKAKASAGSMWDELNFIAIDVEIAGIQQEKIVKAIELLADKKCIVYTSKSKWDNEGYTDLHDLAPLWTAHYYSGKVGWDTYSEEEILTNTWAYGGWGWGSGLVARQFENDTVIEGVTVDLSIFYRNWVTGEPTMPEPEKPVESEKPVEKKLNAEDTNALREYKNAVGRETLTVEDLQIAVSSDWKARLV